MNKEQQIEEIEKVLQDEQLRISNTTDGFKKLMKDGVCKCHAEALYNAGYRKTFASDFASDTQKAYKEGYEKGIEETKAEIEILKIQNKNLGIAFDRLNVRTEKLEVYNDKLSQGIYFGNGEQFSIAIEKAKQKAVKEFAEKLKKIVFEQGNPYNVPYEEFSQANVLFMVIDELLKEYENE